MTTSFDRRAFVLGLTVPAATAMVHGAEVPKLRDQAAHWMEMACVHGAVAGIIEKGTISAIQSFGVRHEGQSGAVDSETLFEAASLSKPVFASAVLRLVEAKELDLDRPLKEILTLTDDPRASGITARHVLSHSSGLQNWRNPRNDKF
jgi:CubicO group peptidase (beta-lactamase class C family)